MFVPRLNRYGYFATDILRLLLLFYLCIVYIYVHLDVTSIVTVAGICNLVSGGVFLHATAVPVANIGGYQG